jgi:branched-chain amino acid:cation transporter, LIVCS family
MQKRIVMTSGLALFAMFFGAGNLVYPLTLGAEAGSHIIYALAAFLIAGVGLPFLGLFATSLYQGDYWKFFQRLGKTPSFLLITFLVLIIGPLFAIPRTEAVTYRSLVQFLPSPLNNSLCFSAIYCMAILLLTYRQTKIIDIIGRFLSPVKLVTFFLLIIMGLLNAQPTVINPEPISASIKAGLLDGYSTMDLLATFFFCTIIYRSILLKTKLLGIADNKTIVKIFLKSCLVGAILLACVYTGFSYVALGHASQLQGIETGEMIQAISNVVFGKFGSIFVGICVSFACIATATAVTEVTTNFFYEHILKKKVSRITCLIATLIMVFAMSIMGFSGIMKIALPILVVLYPALIAYCIINITIKFYGYRKAYEAASVNVSF